MRKSIVGFLVVATVVGVAVPAAAQEQNAQGARCADQPQQAAGNSRDVSYCFNGEDVAGGVVGPAGQRSVILRPRHGTSLIRMRAHFVNEMLRNVENL